MKLFVFAAAALAATSVAQAQVHNEVGDAGMFAGTAQATTGAGALTTINGSLDSNGVDFSDFYIIDIKDPLTFSANTFASTGMGDTVLYLFDLAGNGIAKNDDQASGIDFLSELPAGNALYSGLTPGQYIIGITPYGIAPAWNSPVTVAGDLNFPITPFTATVGPNAGAGPVIDYGAFAAGPYDTGAYTITLTGASFVPTPGALALLGMGGLLVSRRRR